MKRGWLVLLMACGVLLPWNQGAKGADPGISLVGVGAIPGDAADLSGLTGDICQRDDESVCIPRNTLGGLGSALTYTGGDGVFVAVPDRGPFDGRTSTPYLDRFHFLRLAVNVGAAFPNVTADVLDTRLLMDRGNTNLVGDAYNFAGRFDPEGVAVSRDGGFFVSDEYGPSILKFNREGHLLARIAVPAKFLLAPEPFGHPSGDLDAGGNSLELYPGFNVTGRQANRGMEGLAITPDGTTLVGLMQNALLQDHGLDAAISRVGVNNRILTINLETGETHEYVYVMDAVNQGRGANEILAINDHEFLVLERDNRTRVPTPPSTSVQTPNLKRLYKIDLSKPGLTDVSGVASLPQTAAQLAGQGIVPVTKTLFLDLLDPAYTVNGTPVRDLIAEKIEGLAWGPNLPDGRRLLYVISDNDLSRERPTQIYAFGIDAAAAGLNYTRQLVDGPLFAPGQLKKAVR